jgi:hypothetical protein
MAEIAVGQMIRVPCKVQPGPFSEEHLVTIDTVDGPISGFIREDNLIQSNGKWYAQGVVREIQEDAVLVWIKGSFFTTNGLANVSRHLAQAA